MDNAASIFAVGGENLIDHVTHDGQVTAKPGGSPFNIAMGLGRQGQTVKYISPISTDAWGDTLAATLMSSGVDCVGGRVDLPTTMARVEITKGLPTYRFERDGTAERSVTAATLDAHLVGASALHTGSLTLTAGADAQIWEDVVARAHTRGLFTSLDPNVRLTVIQDVAAYRARVFRMLQSVHLLKLSDEDLEALFPHASQEDAFAELRRMTSAELIILTLGPKGARGVTQSLDVAIEAAPVPKLIDSVGAGDTFMATVLAALGGRARPAALSQDELTKLLFRASTAAALNCGREGCDPPTDAELAEALA